MTATGIFADVYSDSYVAGGTGGGVIPPRWNPNTPDVAGDEWLAAHIVSPGLGSALGRCSRLHATVTENVATLIPLIDASAAGKTSQHVLVCADVYDLANPLVDKQLWALAVPASNGPGSGQSPGGSGVGQGWQKSSAAGVWTPYDANAWQNVNDVVASNTPLSTGAQDQLVYSPATATPSLILFNAGSTLYDGDTGLQNQAIAGKRIARVEVVCVVENRLPNGCTIEGVITDPGHVRYTSDSGPVSIAGGGALTRIAFAFYFDPADHQAWDATRCAGFLNGDRWFGIKAAAQPNAAAVVGDGLLVTTVMVQFRVLTERRVATGYATVPLGKAWRAITLTDPLTGAASPWAKVTGHDYLTVFSLTNDGGAASLRALDCANVAEHETDELTNLLGADVSIDSGAVPTAAPITNPAAVALLLRNAGNVSLDSQPYAAVEVQYVNVTNDAEQLISTEAAGTFGAASILVRSQPDGHGGVLEDAPLSVSLRKTSDDSLLAGPASITADDVPPDGKFHQVTVRFPASAVLTANEQVYLKLTSASTRGWVVQTMLTRDLSVDASDAVALSAAAVGVGGQVDFAEVNGAADLTADFPFAIRAVPPLLAGAAAVAATVPNIPALTGTYRPSTLGYAALSWTASVLGVKFLRYEVQRHDFLTQDAATGTWQTIARITNEANAYFNDREAPRNIVTTYRVRVVGTPIGQSDWTTFSPVIVPADTCDLIFASNWNPDLSFGAQDADTNTPPRDYAKLPGTGHLTTRDLYGYDYPAAFRRTERGGDVFTRRLGLAYNDPAVRAGTVYGDRALLDVPIALFHDPSLPYVAVCDGYGRRWFAAADVGGGSTIGGIKSYADVTFVEVASVPTPVVTSTPWTP